MGFDGTGVTIGVVDSGIVNHPDLNDKVIGGYDMMDYYPSDGIDLSNDGDPGRDAAPTDPGDWHPQGFCGPDDGGAPSVWHGSHVAGIAGVSAGASLLPVRALGRCGGYTSDIADAMAWAVGVAVPDAPANNNPADVINLSLGGNSTRCAPMYQDAINAARNAGSTLLVAAGNEDQDTYAVQPANCDGVIVIGATGSEGHRSIYSNYGEEVDLGAPGGNMWPQGWQEVREAGIYSTVDTGRFGSQGPGYDYMEGTSMATPVVSGVVAMMKHANPALTPDRIEEILKTTTQPYTEEPNNFDLTYRSWKTADSMGAGLVDAYAAVCQAIVDGGGECADPAATPTDPTESVPAEPTEPSQPSEPANPGEPTDPSEPGPIVDVDPTPGEPGKPGNLDPTKPGAPVFSVRDWWPLLLLAPIGGLLLQLNLPGLQTMIGSLVGSSNLPGSSVLPLTSSDNNQPAPSSSLPMPEMNWWESFLAGFTTSGFTKPVLDWINSVFPSGSSR